MTETTTQPGYQAALAAMEALQVETIESRRRKPGEFTLAEWGEASGVQRTAARRDLWVMERAGKVIAREGVLDTGHNVLFFRLAE